VHTDLCTQGSVALTDPLPHTMVVNVPIDPLKLVNELVVIIVVIVVLVFLWKYRERVIMALTGDTVIHITPLGTLWWILFRCCGCCTGEWTRYLTRTVCCCKRLRGANLVRELGKVLGLQTYTVEMKNIVVGDLPFSGHGDFYLSVECAANPPMMTSLQMESNPKVVHFPEVITLRVRNSILEQRVTITVKELNVFGSDELCEVRLSAESIIDWASHGWTSEKPLQERIKRFEMKPISRQIESVTQPWILVEFDEPSDERGLSNWQYKPNVIRTMTDANVPQDYSVKAAKDMYTLVNANDNDVEEPDEDDLWKIECARNCVAGCFNFFQCLSFLLVLTYCSIRFYIWSCYRQFKWLTMVSLNNGSFPVSITGMHEIVKKCEDKYLGTGQADGVPCRPSPDQVVEMCQKSELYNFSIPHMPHQPRPTAFKGIVHDAIGYNIRTGIPCARGVCKFNAELSQYDTECIIICVTLIISTFLLRWFLNYMIRWWRGSLAKQRNKEKEEFKKQQREQKATRGLTTWLGTSS